MTQVQIFKYGEHHFERRPGDGERDPGWCLGGTVRGFRDPSSGGALGLTFARTLGGDGDGELSGEALSLGRLALILTFPLTGDEAGGRISMFVGGFMSSGRFFFLFM